MTRDDELRRSIDHLPVEHPPALPANDNTDWPEPTPLRPKSEAPTPYPIDCLPPTARAAVLAYQRFGQQPLELVAGSALGAMSLAIQGLVDVQRDGNLRGPCSLALLTIAESGERKTSCDRRMSRALLLWEQEERLRRKPDHDRARAQEEVANARIDGLVARIRRLATGRKPEQEAERRQLQQELEGLRADPVRPAPLPMLFFEDVSPEALAVDFGRGWPSASLWSDEAGLVVGSRAMGDDAVLRTFGLYNRLWDGRSFRRRRTSSESVELAGRRFTVNLMLQPSVMQQLLGIGDGLVRGTGNLARFLIAAPVSTRGQRPYRAVDLEAAALQRFDRRLGELLARELPCISGPGSPLAPPVLALSPVAFECWRAHHDTIERALRPGARYADFPDFASKTPEQTARLAALFHVMENGPDGTIDADTLGAAAHLATWYLDEGKRALSRPNTADPDTAAAQQLLDWLADSPVPRCLDEVLQKGPNRLRRKEARDRALERLERHGHIRVDRDGQNPPIRLHPHHRQD